MKHITKFEMETADIYSVRKLYTTYIYEQERAYIVGNLYTTYIGEHHIHTYMLGSVPSTYLSNPPTRFENEF